MGFDGPKVHGRSVTRMKLEAIGGMHSPGPLHHPVSCNLGDDRRGCNRERSRIPLDYGLRFAGHARRLVAPIGQHQSRRKLKPKDGAAHGIEACAQYVDPVDQHWTG